MPEETFRWVLTGAVGIATLCILGMAIVALMLYKAMSRFEVRLNEMTTRVEPLIDTVRKVAQENAPKISSVTSNVLEISTHAKDISTIAKDQVHQFAEVGRDIADRTKAQVARVDSVVDDTVEQVQHAGDSLRSAVKRPVREASAVVAGVKAAVSTLKDGRRPTVDHIHLDEEMFI
jgi:hypothetical protein